MKLKLAAIVAVVFIVGLISICDAKKKTENVYIDDGTDRVQSVSEYWGYDANAKPQGAVSKDECGPDALNSLAKDRVTRTDYNVVEYLPKRPWNQPLKGVFWQYGLTHKSCECVQQSVGTVKAFECYAVKFQKPRTALQETGDKVYGRYEVGSPYERSQKSACQPPPAYFNDLGLQPRHVNDC